MRRVVIVCALSLIATQALAAEIKGASVIDAVTVYPAGAEIARIGKVAIERGEHTLLFTDLPADAVASSIRVEGKATGKLEIGSVDTRIVQVPRSDEQAAATERRRVEQDIEKLRDERALLQATIHAAETQKRLVDNLAQMPAQPQLAGSGPIAQPNWNELFMLIGQRGAEAHKTILETQIKARETERQIKDLEGKLASLSPTRRARMEVKVSVGAAAALEASIVIRYQVRRAAWTPYYDARLSTGTKAEAPKLQLVRRASIEQRSGESWENVALSLSTARPSAGTAAPLLSALVVDFESERPPPPAPAARPSPTSGLRNAPMTARRSTDLGDDRLEAEALAADEARAKVEVQAFQAIYGIVGRVTVPDTGETKRVQIDTMELDPALAVRAVPRRDEKAYLYAKVTVARGTPLLPGSVSLFRDATFVGNGRLPLLAPGEQHELGFGVDDAVRVRYAIAEEKRGETGIISSSKTDTRSYRITAKNLHPRPIALTVLDQIPVSLNADIKIDLIGKSVPSRRDVDDKRGVLAWDATLAPDEERAVEFGYRATWPAGKNVTYGQGS
jgi:uncharacterized protein (TIGR02231 family)